MTWSRPQLAHLVQRPPSGRGGARYGAGRPRKVVRSRLLPGLVLRDLARRRLVQARLTSDELAAVRQRARESGRTVSDLLRRALGLEAGD